jgi:hypothetical protein
MDLMDAMQMGRQLLKNNGLPHFYLFLFDLPQPDGVHYRNNIGLNAIYVLAHDSFDVAGTILHEVAHGHLDGIVPLEESKEHGADFQATCLRLRGDVSAPPSTNEDFTKLVGFYRENAQLQVMGDSCMASIVKELDRWSDAGLQGCDDLETFMVEPYIMGKSIYER